MTRTRRLAAAYIALAAAVAVLFALNLFWGSVSLAPGAVLTALLGKGGDALAGNIILQLRLPRAVMTVLLGAALSAAGYLLQTFFANPIAGPFVMGVSSGAKLAVALTMVVFLDRGMLTSSATMIAAAFAGAMAAMAIVLAVGVWMYVINVENPSGTGTVREIPVTVVGEDSLAERGLMVTEQNRDHVSLKLSGRKKTLMKLNRKNITLKLDVSSVTSEGEHTLSCKVDFPDTVGDNVSISDWEDLHVTVTVEKQATKEIPVRGEFIGTEADNCLAGAVTTDPETLVLKGPAKELEGISYALATVGGKEVRDTIVEQSSVVFMGPDGTPASCYRGRL